MQNILAISDLAVRWSYTRAGVHVLAQQADFPLPIGQVCLNRIRLYALDDIRVYEQSRPWLLDTNEKEQRVKGYHRALTRGDLSNG